MDSQSNRTFDLLMMLRLWVSKTMGWSLGRPMTNVRCGLLSRRFGHDMNSPPHDQTASGAHMPELPLLLISPYSDLSGFTDRINELSRSRIAEVQWMPYLRDCDELDNFAECDDQESYLASYPLRRVALISNSRNHNVLGFISPLLDTKDKFLWVSQLDSAAVDFLEYFLKGHLSPAALRPQNYEMFTKWLGERHGVFAESFRNEFERHDALVPQLCIDDRSVSKWLTSAGYADDLHKSFVRHLQALEPRLDQTWSMPPVPPDGRELPLILLEFDGCFADTAEKSVVHPFMVDRINQWSRNRTAEVRKMSIWGYSEGLDTFADGRDLFVEDTDKDEQVLRWIDRNPERKIVWVDYEIHKHLSLFGQKIDGDAALVERMMQHRNLLMVQPQAKQGLTADELQMIDTFLAGGMKVEEVLAQKTCVVHDKRNGVPRRRKGSRNLGSATIKIAT